MNQLPKIIPISDFRARQNDLLGQLQKGPIVLTQHGSPAAVMIDPIQWDRLAAELEDLSDAVAALEIQVQLLKGEDETIPWQEAKAELDGVGERTIRPTESG